MSGPFGSSQWMYSSGGFYPTTIEQSLRFNDDDSAYLSRTPASAGNRKTWTWSGWVKPCNTNVEKNLLSVRSGTSYPHMSFWIEDSNNSTRLRILEQTNSANLINVETTASLRDSSAWYHIVLTVDTTEATASDRVKLYINGVQQTALSLTEYPSLNADLVTNSTTPHAIGRRTRNNGVNNYSDKYLAEVYFVDGTALDPTDFGEFKSGVWVAKSYAGNYGTNGFYLNFSDSANIGDDLSGNANDWTANNLVATDVVLDSPTNNWATLNPLDKNTQATTSEGNLKVNTGTTEFGLTKSTFKTSNGKWYFEYLNSSGTYHQVGISTDAELVDDGSNGDIVGRGSGYGYRSDTGAIYHENSVIATYATYSSGDIVGVAYDLDAGSVSFYKNGTLQGTISSIDTSVVYAPATADRSANDASVALFNFGQDSSFAGNKTAQGNTDDNGVGDFYYAPPSGYLALCTANLPDPAIDPAQDDVPADYFNTVLYTGNGSTQSVTVGWQPDWVWIKSRTDGGRWHALFDAVRGTEKRLFSNETNAEDTTANTLTSFDSDGFTLGSQAGQNGSGDSFVAWNWLAGNGTSSNTSGSITSTVSVNQKAGFSIVSYTGTNSATETVGHGLGATPSMVIVKTRDSADFWPVYHSGVDATAPENYLMRLNTTDARLAGSVYWNNTAPTSSVFTIGTSSALNNTDDFIAYCFAEVEGYSKFGSYTGNGSTDGPFVYTGFRPAWVMFKPTNRADEWRIMDVARNEYNVLNLQLYPNNSSAELTSTNYHIDYLSNGFKPRTGHDGFNRSGDTYIFMAFAELPFKYSLGR